MTATLTWWEGLCLFFVKKADQRQSEIMQQQYYWTEAVQVTTTHDRPDLPSEGVPYIDKTVNVKQKLISGHETQMGLDTKMDWLTNCRS
jgi:hypothetical protein